MVGLRRHPFQIKEDLIATPLKTTATGVEVPTAPGLGVELDWEKIEKYKRKS
jgi:muconate cycloisomerase